MERGTTQKPRPRKRTTWLQSSSRREFQKCGHKRCTRQVQNFVENRGATHSAWPPASLTTTPEEQQLGPVDFIDIIVFVNVSRCTLKASISLLSTLLVSYAFLRILSICCSSCIILKADWTLLRDYWQVMVLGEEGVSFFSGISTEKQTWSSITYPCTYKKP